MQKLNIPLDIDPHIKEAIKSNGPVVALESTIITHGKYNKYREYMILTPFNLQLQ